MAFSSALLKSLNQQAKQKAKKGNSDFIYDPHRKVEVIPSGSVVMDRLTGVGGYPTQRITEIYGESGSGKTTLALHAVKSAQDLGKNVIFMDYEQTFDATYAEQLGIDTENSKLLVLQPTSLEEGWDLLQEMPELLEEAGLVIFDSVATMIPKVRMEGSSSDSEQIGTHAKKMTNFINWWIPKCKMYNLVCILINQERVNLANIGKWSPGDDTNSTGGKALFFACSLKFQLTPGKKYTEEGPDEITGETQNIPIWQNVRIVNKKNKISHPFLRGSIRIKFGFGVDNSYALIKAAEKKGKITRAGAWFSFKSFHTGEDVRIQGSANLETFFLENPKEYKALNKWFSEEDFFDGSFRVGRTTLDDEISAEESLEFRKSDAEETLQLDTKVEEVEKADKVQKKSNRGRPKKSEEVTLDIE